MDNGRSNDTAGGTEESATHYQSIIEAVQHGVFVIDLNGTITYANDSLCSLLGRERNKLVGTAFETAAKSVLIHPEAHDRFASVIRDISDGELEDHTFSFEIATATDRVVDVRVSKHVRDDGTEEIVGVVQDVTERERRAETAEQKQEVLAKLYDIGSNASLTFEDKAERILALGCEYLDLPYGFLTRIEQDVQRMVHTVGDHELLQPDESAPLERSYCRQTIKSDGLVGMEDARANLGDEDPAYERFELGCYIGTKIMVGESLYGTFCFAGPKGQAQQFTSDQREVVKLLGQWSGYELERQLFEKRLRGLYQLSQRLLLAETTEAVAESMVKSAAGLFDLPLTAYWEYGPDNDVLRPLAETDEAVEIIGEAPTFERGDGLIWESFENGDIRTYDDVTDRPQRHNPQTDVQAEIHVPCGDHGVIMSAATEPRAFDKIDIESLRLLGTVVTEAMTAVKREERLIERGEALQRQNDRLEEFADVVAHDLRNPLAGAIGSFKIARETNETEFFDRVEQSLERMDDLIGELLDIARGNHQATTMRAVSLQPIVEEAWSYIDAAEATLSVVDQLGEVQADETLLLQLFGNLLRNSIEHGGDDAAVEVGLLTDGTGFYVADDGPGMTEDGLAAVQELEDGSQKAAIGIGLLSVGNVLAEHGWDHSVSNTTRGLRFEVRTSEHIE